MSGPLTRPSGPASPLRYSALRCSVLRCSVLLDVTEGPA
jgi:hypothetical protein